MGSSLKVKIGERVAEVTEVRAGINRLMTLYKVS